MAKHLMLVFTNPTAGQDAEYNDWYNTTHLPEVVALDGISAAQRFAIGDESSPHKYLAIYEIEADPATVGANLGAAAQNGSMNMSSALDTSTAKIVFVTPIADRLVK